VNYLGVNSILMMIFVKFKRIFLLLLLFKACLDLIGSNKTTDVKTSLKSSVKQNKTD